MVRDMLQSLKVFVYLLLWLMVAYYGVPAQTLLNPSRSFDKYTLVGIFSR